MSSARARPCSGACAAALHFLRARAEASVGDVCVRGWAVCSGREAAHPSAAF